MATLLMGMMLGCCRLARLWRACWLILVWRVVLRVVMVERGSLRKGYSEWWKGRTVSYICLFVDGMVGEEGLVLILFL